MTLLLTCLLIHIFEIDVVDPSSEFPPIDTEADSSRPPGVTRSHLYEPGLVDTDGTWTLECLAISELPFITDYYLFHLEKITHRPFTVKPPAGPLKEDYEEDELEPLQFAYRGESTPEEAYVSDIAVDDGEDRELDLGSDVANHRQSG